MHLGVSYNGSTPVSKTVNAGSIPVTPATQNFEAICHVRLLLFF